MPDRDWAWAFCRSRAASRLPATATRRRAVLHCNDAVDTLAARCAGAVWERVTAQRFLIAALFHSGQLARLNAIVPPLLAEAEATANLYARQFLRSGYSIASWLVRDEVTKHADNWRSPTRNGVPQATNCPSTIAC